MPARTELEAKLMFKSPALDEELAGQQQFLKTTGTLLIGRDRELKRIDTYLARKQASFPLIIQATGGTGKSALMARAAQKIALGFSVQKEGVTESPLIAKRDPGGFLIYRFVGATPRSWQPFTFLEDLITQISTAYGHEPPALPEEGGLRAAAALFHQQLERATREQPLTILIDAIDQFNSTVPVQYSDIFPKQLPDHVKMVISVLEGQDADQLADIFPQSPRLRLEPLSPFACGNMLDALVSPKKLTREQRDAILEKATESGLPLWLTLAAPIAKRLDPGDIPPALPGTIKELARYVIQDMAGRHGTVITMAYIRYLKLARYGLSATELQEVIQQDPVVWEECSKHNQALPSTILSLLYAELDPYINGYLMDGQLLQRYFHRILGEVADEIEPGTRAALHSRLADYFERQPLYLETVAANGIHTDGNDANVRAIHELLSNPNGRKLMELPYHLAKAERIEEARIIITNFDFAMAKCRLNRSDDWVSDFRLVSGNGKSHEYRIWERFITTNAQILRRGNSAWPAHKILLQRTIEHADDSPATIAAEKFLAEGKCDWTWLRKECRVSHAGIDPAVAVFEGHTSSVKGLQELPDGKILSWSGDCTLRIWEKESGISLRVLEGHKGGIEGVHLCTGNRALSWAWNYPEPDSSIRVWDLSSGRCLSVMEGDGRLGGVHLLPDDRALAWYTCDEPASTNNVLRMWDISSGCCLAVMNMASSQERVNINVQLLSEKLALSWSCHYLQLWDLVSYRCLAEMKGHTDTIGGVRLFPDNRAISWSFGEWSVSKENTRMRLWDLSDGHSLAVMKGHTGQIRNVLPLTGNRAISWCTEQPPVDRTMRLWDVSNGRCLMVMKGHKQATRGALMLEDGTIVSWAGDTLYIWDCANGTCQAQLSGHAARIRGVLALPCNRLLSWSYDGTLRIWDVAHRTCLHLLEGHTSRISEACLLPGNRILSWSEDNTLRVWSQEDGNCLAVMEGHAGSIHQLPTMLSDGRMLTTAIQENFFQMWDIDNCELIEPPAEKFVYFEDEDKFIKLPDGKLLHYAKRGGIGHYSHSITVRDPGDGRRLAGFQGIDADIEEIQLLPDDRILTLLPPHDLRIWDAASGNCLLALRGHKKFIAGVKQLSGNRLLSWASEEKNIRIWNSKNGRCIRILKGHRDTINGIHLLPDEKVLSWSGGYENSKDSSLRIWDISTGRCLKVMEGHTGEISCVQLLPGNRAISWCSSFGKDYAMRLWDLSTGNCLAVMDGHSKHVREVIQLHDGNLLSYSFDYTIRIWEGASWACKTVINVPQLLSVSLFAGGELLTWGSDNIIRRWNSSNGSLISTMTGHTGNICEVIVLSDGRLLSYGEDKTLRIWDSTTGKCLAVLKRKESGNMAELTSDGRILCWPVFAKDREVRVWDKDGELLAVYDWSRLFAAPEDIWRACMAKYRKTARAGLACFSSTAMIGYRQHDVAGCLYWQAASKMFARYLFEDGSALVRHDQDDILRPWLGNNRISVGYAP